MSDSIKGMDKLLKKIKKIEELKGIDKGLNKATARVETRAKELCPVDDGTLRASITSKVKDGVGTVGTNVEYAPHIEFGTKNMSAQPYLFPALEQNREQIKKDIAEAIHEEVKND